MTKNNVTIPHNFIPRDYQLPLFQAMDGVEGDLESKCRRAFIMWHRRAGKDTACTAYIFKEMATTVGQYFYLFPTTTQAKKVIWDNRDMMGMLPGFHDKKEHGKPGCIIKRVNNVDLTIELVNGSLFRLVGTDKYDAIMGTNPIGCIFSEYSLQIPEAWDYIRPILAENGGWAIFNGTPRGRNHFYKLFMNTRDNHKWYCSVRQTLYPDEPYYTGAISPQAIKDELDSGMDADRCAQEFGCSFEAAAKGSYYNDLILKAKEEGRVGNYPNESDQWTHTVWDIGYKDSTAVWFFQKHGSTIRLVDYYENSNQEIPFYINMLQDRGYRYGVHYLPWESFNKDVRGTTDEIFRKYLASSQVGGTTQKVAKKHTVQHGIDLARSHFTKFYFNETPTYKGLELLSLYTKEYNTKLQTFKDKPLHDYTSHCADALRYLAMVIEEDNSNIVDQTLEVISMESPYDY